MLIVGQMFLSAKNIFAFKNICPLFDTLKRMKI